jgi:predicted DNA-binding transcriptional regulator YafY
MKNSNRLLLILKFLLNHTDLDYAATVVEINESLKTQQLDCDRRTIYDCIAELQEIGYPIECVHLIIKIV